MTPSPPGDAPIARTPDPPYVAVIFTSLRTEVDDGYAAMNEEMERLARNQAGYLGIESVRAADGCGITVSYWKSAEDARAWKRVAEHLHAQHHGRAAWYQRYRVRVARVEREYGFDREAQGVASRTGSGS